MLRLVVNGDDLGLHPAIDAGIFRARRDGILTSTTVLATGRTAREAIAAANAVSIGVGVHLSLTTMLPPAAPAERVPSVAPKGKFRRSWPDVVIAMARRELKLSEVEEELYAQVARARELGAKVDHLDGHQHLHALPGVAEIVRTLAREQNLPIRKPLQPPRRRWMKKPGALVKASLLGALSLVTLRGLKGLDGIGTFEAGMLDEARLLELLRELKDGDHELGCHPGEWPGTVEEDPAWTFGWEQEVAALTSARVRELIAERGVKLCTYAELFA